MSPQFDEFAQAARSYCRLIECIDCVSADWLKQVYEHLTQLNSLVSGMDVNKGRAAHHFLVDLDARFELFSELRGLLGEFDSYWLEFDADGDGSNRTGSLADDLTDIYCELKHGLAVMDGSPSSALEGWCTGYKVHWGQHLVDAERHLFALQTRRL